jgi:hypothetical protein
MLNWRSRVKDGSGILFILPGFSRRIKKTIDRAIEIFAKAFGIKRYSEQPGPQGHAQNNQRNSSNF